MCVLFFFRPIHQHAKEECLSRSCYFECVHAINEVSKYLTQPTTKEANTHTHTLPYEKKNEREKEKNDWGGGGNIPFIQSRGHGKLRSPGRRRRRRKKEEKKKSRSLIGGAPTSTHSQSLLCVFLQQKRRVSYSRRPFNSILNVTPTILFEKGDDDEGWINH